MASLDAIEIYTFWELCDSNHVIMLLDVWIEMFFSYEIFYILITTVALHKPTLI